MYVYVVCLCYVRMYRQLKCSASVVAGCRISNMGAYYFPSFEKNTLNSSSVSGLMLLYVFGPVEDAVKNLRICAEKSCRPNNAAVAILAILFWFNEQVNTWTFSKNYLTDTLAELHRMRRGSNPLGSSTHNPRSRPLHNSRYRLHTCVSPRLFCPTSLLLSRPSCPHEERSEKK